MELVVASFKKVSERARIALCAITPKIIRNSTRVRFAAVITPRKQLAFIGSARETISYRAEMLRALSITPFEGSHLLFGGGRGAYGESNLTA